MKSVLRKCATCCRYQDKQLLPPETPDLPNYRVNTLNAFQCTGLDYSGPLFQERDYCNVSNGHVTQSRL